jgi:F-type H+-transporting ATPase subunit delta
LCAELDEFADLLSVDTQIMEILTSPLLPGSKKEEIANLILEQTSMGNKTKRFLLLLVENNRLALLPEIREILPKVWNEDQGIMTFEVRSVIPLNPSQKKRLEEKLSALEGRPVELTYQIDPSLIGGLSIRKGNIVFDISIQGDLERIKQKIVEE